MKTMKKIAVILLALIMIFAVAACGNDSSDETAQDQQTQEQTQDQEQTNPEQKDDGLISKGKAKRIAANDAGFKKADVEFKKCKLDLDDGIQEYEVEFVQGETEYDYSIDAATGDILEKDSESVYDD
ncbi:MAG: PepSY domain-containing protein [Bacillota bacterium]|nr:PepSY domain-containing protein [Bacillota bacterium]